MNTHNATAFLIFYYYFTTLLEFCQVFFQKNFLIFFKKIFEKSIDIWLFLCYNLDIIKKEVKTMLEMMMPTVEEMMIGEVEMTDELLAEIYGG